MATDDAIVTIANGNSLTHPTPFADNFSFLMWGNDDVALSNVVTETINGTSMNHLARTWRVQESGTVAETAVSFNLTDLELNWVAGDVALLIDADTDFSDATLHTTGRAVVGDVITFTNVDFSDGDYFTLVLMTDKQLTMTSENGTVTSDPAGVDCGTTCSADFSHGTVVELTAVPAEDCIFTSWSGGGCSGTGACVVEMVEAKQVTATFALSQQDLSVIISESGSGTVYSSPAGISCESDCTETFVYGTVVTLTATPAEGYAFTVWSGGGCSGTEACVVEMNDGVEVTAVFDKDEYLIYLPMLLNP